MVGEYWRGEISLRELRVLTQGLPQDSAVTRAHLGHTWTSDRDWMLADIRDGIAALTVMFHNVNRAEGTAALQPPDPVARPGMEDIAAANEKAERASHDRLSGMLLKGR